MMESETKPANQTDAASPLSSMLSSLLANPEMLRQIQAVFGNTSSAAGTATETTGSPSDRASDGNSSDGSPADGADRGTSSETASESQSADALGNLLSKLSQNGSTATESGNTAIPTGGIPADGLSAVLANPEMMAKLPQMMAILGPLLGGNGTKPSAPPHPQERSPEDYRNDLLLALKPFLSPERRNAIDAIMRISKLGNVLRQMK